MVRAIEMDPRAGLTGGAMALGPVGRAGKFRIEAANSNAACAPETDGRARMVIAVVSRTDAIAALWRAHHNAYAHHRTKPEMEEKTRKRAPGAGIKPAATLEQASGMIDWYGVRREIEMFFHLLKMAAAASPDNWAVCAKSSAPRWCTWCWPGALPG